ncbi:phage major capsid protein [Mycolicibacterium smegmatis]|uniref:phage major capsid protein n=1 Tax=Mycolicibacterium smegmatis TaxID=1772 RepID=UPI0005DA3A0D|nr:phage major capsid protein [Mycolicibacterium smegmatis]MDF1902748.1 phage major capsid protein [Mycolicibacterium smegmatis]MDF1909024.1 phage major capsid protein [Mycolicibacterium smegmatis]MDF1921243.1 phage major capsid protein [Mycolicibacterium smegmatis]MDF1927508.1 phage major capsid protein [Mycolicibacterium smegmatis]UAK53365.1 phage major capsid protein [Mycolicibacterium smegmatis]
MAQADPTVRGDFSGFLRPEIADRYFDEARKRSTVMQLARRVPLGINGQEIPVSTAKAQAAWVSEGNTKPTTESAQTLKTIAPKKLAAISVVSAEVVRANPGNYMEVLREDIAEAFAVAFDNAALHGTSTPFGAYIDQTDKTVELGTATQNSGGVYADLVSGMSLLVNDGKKLRGFALDAVAEPVLLGATDNTGRPLFVETPLADTTSAIVPGRLLGRPAYLGDSVASGDTVAYGGDWSQVVWGAVGGISFKVSTEAAVTINGALVSLFEKNLVAILAEAEYGLLINDVDAFCRYTVDNGS